MTDRWPDARYACINLNEALAPEEIAKNPSVSKAISGKFWHSSEKSCQN